MVAGVGSGNLKAVQALRENDWPMSSEAFELACSVGRMEVLEYLKREGCEIMPDNAFLSALSAADTNVLFWLKINGIGPWEDSVVLKLSIIHAHRSEKTELLKWLAGVHFDRFGEKVVEDASSVAAEAIENLLLELKRDSRLEDHELWADRILSFMPNSSSREKNEISSDSLSDAENALRDNIAKGNLSEIKNILMRSKIGDPDMSLCDWAVESGNDEVIMWLLDEGYWWGASAMEYAVKHGKIEMLKKLLRCGGKLTAETAEMAVECGNVEALDWLYGRRCPMPATLHAIAAAKGNIDVLMKLKRWHVETDDSAVIEASRAGQLECLKWLLENDFDADRRSAEAAASNPSLENFLALEYLVLKKCQFDRKAVLRKAATCGNIHILTWMKGQGDLDEKLSSELLDLAGRNGNLEAAKWLRNFAGAPWPENIALEKVRNFEEVPTLEDDHGEFLELDQMEEIVEEFEPKGWSKETFEWAQSEGLSAEGK